MTVDLRALRDTAATTTARCNTARVRAEEARTAADMAELHQWPDRHQARVKADRAMDHFYDAMDDRDQARRALRDALEREGASA